MLLFSKLFFESSNYMIFSLSWSLILKRKKNKEKGILKTLKELFLLAFLFFSSFHLSDLAEVQFPPRSLTLRHQRSLGQLVTCSQTHETGTLNKKFSLSLSDPETSAVESQGVISFGKFLQFFFFFSPCSSLLQLDWPGKQGIVYISR